MQWHLSFVSIVYVSSVKPWEVTEGWNGYTWVRRSKHRDADGVITVTERLEPKSPVPGMTTADYKERTYVVCVPFVVFAIGNC